MHQPPRSHNEIKKLFGPGADQILLKLIGDEKIAAQAFDHYVESQSHKASSMKVYDGMRELFNQLKTAGIPMGLVTGRHSRDLEVVLNAHQLKDYFYVIVADDDLREAKPSPEGLLNASFLMKLPPQSLYYVGDSKTDIQAAKKAGSHSIAALWDKRVEKEEMRLEDPTFMAESPTDIGTFLPFR
jgi:HAD superfamily hydrolase (TIGR01549 family)